MSAGIGNESEARVRVREATIADVPGIAASRSGDAAAGAADPRVRAYLEGVHHPRFALLPLTGYVAVEGDRVVGYIAGHLSTRFECQGELQYLYVAPAHRRKGVASALLDALAAWFARQGASRVCVDVEPENAPARSFYRRHGAADLSNSWMVWEDMSADREGRGQWLRKIMPELPLGDVLAGVAYYRDVLGFQVNFAHENIGVMDRDAVRLLLVARTPAHAGAGSCYVYVEDADALHAELTGRGARVEGAPVDRPWGLREFRVHDPEGNWITFGQTFEPEGSPISSGGPDRDDDPAT